MPPIPVLTPDQARDWDGRASTAGVQLQTLMENAGRAAAAVLATRLAERLRLGVLVACGPGNNGGDGWVIARALHAAGVAVWVTAAGSRAELPQRMAERAREAGVG